MSKEPTTTSEEQANNIVPLARQVLWRLRVLDARVQAMAHAPLCTESALWQLLGWGCGWHEPDPGLILWDSSGRPHLCMAAELCFVRALLLGTLLNPEPDDLLVTLHAQSLNLETAAFEALLAVARRRASERQK